VLPPVSDKHPGPNSRSCRDTLQIAPNANRLMRSSWQSTADHYATRATQQELGRDEAVECIDSALFRERFLKEAEAQGIVFPERVPSSNCPRPKCARPNVRNGPTVWAMQPLPQLRLLALVLVVITLEFEDANLPQ